MVPSLVFPGRDSSAYCRTVMAILNAKEKKKKTQKQKHRTVSSTQDWLQINHLAGTLASRHSYKETLKPPYIAGNSAVLQTRASLPMLWIFNLFSLISCTLLFLVTVYDGCVWKNVSLGKQLQFVNLKMLVLTHLYFYSHIPPHPHPLTAWEVGEGCQPTVLW